MAIVVRTRWVGAGKGASLAVLEVIEFGFASIPLGDLLDGFCVGQLVTACGNAYFRWKSCS